MSDIKEFAYRFLSGIIGFLLGLIIVGGYYFIQFQKLKKVKPTTIVKTVEPNVKVIIDTIKLTKTKRVVVNVSTPTIVTKTDTIKKDSFIYITNTTIKTDTVLMDYPVTNYVDTLDYDAYTLCYDIEGKDLSRFTYKLGIKPAGIKGYEKSKPYYISGKLGLNTIGGELGYNNFGLGIIYNVQAKWIPFISYKKQFNF